MIGANIKSISTRAKGYLYDYSTKNLELPRTLEIRERKSMTMPSAPSSLDDLNLGFVGSFLDGLFPGLSTT